MNKLPHIPKPSEIKETLEEKIVRIAYLPRLICIHLIGEHHTHGHRMIVGTVFIFIGVIIAKGSAMIGHSLPLHIAGDALGYAIHGMGFVPFGEYVILKGKTEEAKHHEKMVRDRQQKPHRPSAQRKRSKEREHESNY
jgi:hypothetical protein